MDARATHPEKNKLNFTVFAVVLVQVFGIQVSIAVPHYVGLLFP
jgi:hypothetical protein